MYILSVLNKLLTPNEMSQDNQVQQSSNNKRESSQKQVLDSSELPQSDSSGKMVAPSTSVDSPPKFSYSGGEKNSNKKPWNGNNNFKQENKGNFTSNYPKKDKGFPDNMCYALWAINGSSFAAMYKNNKTEFQLADIEVPDKKQPGGKEPYNFLNQLITKKPVFLDIVSNEDGERIVVQAYLDKEKTKSINKLILAEDFSNTPPAKPTSTTSQVSSDWGGSVDDEFDDFTPEEDHTPSSPKP